MVRLTFSKLTMSAAQTLYPKGIIIGRTIQLSWWLSTKTTPVTQTGVAFMVFSIYGRDFVKRRWERTSSRFTGENEGVNCVLGSLLIKT